MDSFTLELMDFNLMCHLVGFNVWLGNIVDLNIDFSRTSVRRQYCFDIRMQVWFWLLLSFVFDFS